MTFGITLSSNVLKIKQTYYGTLKSVCKEIRINPDIGREYTGIKKNSLGFKSGKHIIFYHVISEYEIEVIRILHERMDLKNRLTE